MQDLSKMLVKAESSKRALWMLNYMLDWGAPFNRPHGFHVLEVSDHKVLVKAPFKRKNFNHLNGMHACAIATVGELAAGLMLFRHFPATEYRLIMSEMQVSYIRQAKGDIVAQAGLAGTELTSLQQAIAKDGVAQMKMVSQVRGEGDDHIAKVTTEWQIKSWDQVTYKG